MKTIYNGHYTKFEDDTPFCKAVNKKVSDFWVRTGMEYDIEQAIFEVLAEDYNKRNQKTNPKIKTR